MIMRALTTRLLSGPMAPRLARLIPHPGVRLVATVAASYVLPYVVEQLVTRSATAVARRKMRTLPARTA